LYRDLTAGHGGPLLHGEDSHAFVAFASVHVEPHPIILDHDSDSGALRAYRNAYRRRVRVRHGIVDRPVDSAIGHRLGVRRHPQQARVVQVESCDESFAGRDGV
jgi:hypothetical protein